MKIRKFNEGSSFSFKDICEVLKSNLADLNDDSNLEFYNTSELTAYLDDPSGILTTIKNAAKDHRIGMITYKLPSINYNSKTNDYIFTRDLSIENQITYAKNTLEFLEDLNVAIKRTEEEIGNLSFNIAQTSTYGGINTYFVLIGLKK